VGKQQKAPASRETGALEDEISFSANHGKLVAPMRKRSHSRQEPSKAQTVEFGRFSTSGDLLTLQ
jgi:hypothetical protein